ncbi:hypothetical protein SDC9_126277 [bioreactor metagenome]|uniref:Uncharacterized protein n=1 Tax=bioreactor metagenome TaxID=1076179 RepID=A0A645CQT3_9ZZZZ
MVRNFEYRIAAIAVQGYLHRHGFRRELSGIFQEVDQHLCNQRAVHGNLQVFLWNGNLYISRWKPLANSSDGVRNHFLCRLRQFLQVRCVFVKARHRKQIFHHADEPLGFLLNIGDQLLFCLRTQSLFVFQNCRACTGNSSQRRTDIVRDCPQQIPAHLFPLGFHQNRALLVRETLAFQRHCDLGGDHAQKQAAVMIQLSFSAGDSPNGKHAPLRNQRHIECAGAHERIRSRTGAFLIDEHPMCHGFFI